MKRFLLLFAGTLVFAITAYLYPWSGLKTIPDANATGGAFIYTKHGGSTTVDNGIWCPVPPCGVNRAINPAIGAFYYSDSEAGQYLPGECLHCHEPMASFGGTEPPPNPSSTPSDPAGPSPYLLFKGDYNSTTVKGASAFLCWFCHENYTIGIPPKPPGYGFWGFYQGEAVFRASSHFEPPSAPGTQFYWPGTGALVDPVQIWPRRTRENLPLGNKGSCLNCHTPHGIRAAGGLPANAYDTTTSDPLAGGTGGVPAANQIVCTSLNPNVPAGCNPSVNANYLIPRKLIAWEENLCEACHSANHPSNAIDRIREEINKRYPVGLQGSGHPVDAVTDPSFPANYLAGQHVVSESIPITIAEGTRPITQKHVECYDCHNPHAVKPGGNPPFPSPGTPGTWDDGGRLKGMRYITINGTICDPGATSNLSECTNILIGGIPFSKASAQPFIYELCFKCHGDSYASFIPDRNCTTGDANAPGCIVDTITSPLRTTVLQNNCPTQQTPASSCTDGSNKRLEFNPATQGRDGFGGNFTDNRAFHPVATPGRNTSLALCRQLKAGGFPTLNCTENPLGSGLVSGVGSLDNLTIYCTDCHNNDATGTGTFNVTTATPNFPGPVTESSLRTTDTASSFTFPNDINRPVGPHGSLNPRILRANYNTTFAAIGGSKGNFNAANFALCFQCHNVGPFINQDGSVTGIPGVIATNFFQPPGVGSGLGSLHLLHLNTRTTSSCINCHYNIHSNWEQAHTQYGKAAGVSIPADGDTHLINFSPAVTANGFAKPAWYRITGANMGCTVTCHGVNMDGSGDGVGGGGSKNAVYGFNPS